MNESDEFQKVLRHVWRWKTTIFLFCMAGAAIATHLQFISTGEMIKVISLRIYAGGTLLESREAIEEQVYRGLRLRGFTDVAYHRRSNVLLLERQYNKATKTAVGQEVDDFLQAVKRTRSAINARMDDLLELSRSMPEDADGQGDLIKLENYKRARDSNLLELITVDVVEKPNRNRLIVYLPFLGLMMGVLFSMAASSWQRLRPTL